MMGSLLKNNRSFGRVSGASPSENKFYVLVMFDISGRKKYSLLVKLLKRYSRRIQNSVFEAYLKSADIKELLDGIEKIMRSDRYFDSDDKVRVYKRSSACQAVVFGECDDSGIDLDENLFI